MFTRLKTLDGQIRAELQPTADGLENEAKTLQAQQATMDQATLQVRAATYKQHQQELQKKAQTRSDQWEATKEIELDTISKQMMPLVRDLYEQHRCSILSNVDSGGVNNVNPAMDLSRDVVNALGRQGPVPAVRSPVRGTIARAGGAGEGTAAATLRLPGGFGEGMTTPDPRFFEVLEPTTVGALAALTGADLRCRVRRSKRSSRAAVLTHAEAGSVSFVESQKVCRHGGLRVIRRPVSLARRMRRCFPDLRGAGDPGAESRVGRGDGNAAPPAPPRSGRAYGSSDRGGSRKAWR